MKKVIIAFLAVVLIVAAAFGFPRNAAQEVQTEYLRVHIRANSNSSPDQAVKYLVRDSVVEYLTPVVAECNTKDEAIAAVTIALRGIEEVAKSVLEQNGFFYGAVASIRQEEFPTRVYEDVTLEAGVYDALILELGTGAGDNWWCVVYPPLCFTSGGGNVIYKSKIAEIIAEFFKKEDGE